VTERTLQILLALADGPLHGYGIKRAVEDRTDGTVRLGAGTLYEAIQRLVVEGRIREVGAPADAETSSGPPRRFYDLTDTGREALRDELRRLRDIVHYAEARALLQS
jgi:DNA-binding PadR family transcriptional regulator